MFPGWPLSSVICRLWIRFEPETQFPVGGDAGPRIALARKASFGLVGGGGQRVARKMTFLPVGGGGGLGLARKASLRLVGGGGLGVARKITLLPVDGGGLHLACNVTFFLVGGGGLRLARRRTINAPTPSQEPRGRSGFPRRPRPRLLLPRSRRSLSGLQVRCVFALVQFCDSNRNWCPIVVRLIDFVVKQQLTSFGWRV